MYDRFGRSFVPMFHPGRRDEPLKYKHPLKIFVGSVTDVGGGFIKPEWMNELLNVVKQAYWHTFQFLTKRPRGLHKYAFPANTWVGTTITQGKVAAREAIIDLAQVKGPTVRFVSFEPLLDVVYPGATFAYLNWIIIGPQTGPGAVPPQRDAVQILLNTANSHGVPVFMKKALKPYVEEWGFPWRREFPM